MRRCPIRRAADLADSSGLAAHEVFDLDAEAPRELRQDPHAWVALAALDAAHVGQRQAGGVGHLFLRHSALGPQATDVRGDTLHRFLGRHSVILLQ